MAVRDDSHVFTFFDRFGLREGKLVRFGWDLLDSGSVKGLGFHEDHRVVACYGGKEEAFGLGGRTRHHDAEARDVCEKGFRGLGVVA